MGEAALLARIAYDEDLAAWVDDQARLLRTGRFAELDLQHLAAEIESVGASQRREVRSRLAILLRHLLKWQFQPNELSRSWSSTIHVQRRDLEDVLEDSPSLRRTVEDVLPNAYKRGREEALIETGLYRLPETCPWTAAQVVSPEFLPD